MTTPPDKSVFSERIKRARLARGLTLVELASRSGMNMSHISHLESGRRSPSVESLVSLAVALPASMDYLCGLTSFDMFEKAKDENA